MTCSSSTSLDVPANCYPIVGAMTAWISRDQQRRLQQQVNPDSNEEQEAALYSIIQSYIEQSQDTFLGDDLLHVTYIGRHKGTDANLVSPVKIDVKTNKEVGMSAGLIGLVVSTVVLASLAFAYALVYRRRQRGSRHEDQGLDLEHGAFPVLIEGDDHDTQDAVASQNCTDENRYNSLFGLTGARSDDSMTGSILASPSSSTTIVATNAVPRQFTPSSTASPKENYEQQGSPSNNMSFDMAPLSPMKIDDTEEGKETIDRSSSSSSSSSDDSSVLEIVDDDSDEVGPIPELMNVQDRENTIV